jgi:hypothetical protein
MRLIDESYNGNGSKNAIILQKASVKNEFMVRMIAITR